MLADPVYLSPAGVPLSRVIMTRVPQQTAAVRNESARNWRNDAGQGRKGGNRIWSRMRICR